MAEVYLQGIKACRFHEEGRVVKALNHAIDISVGHGTGEGYAIGDATQVDHGGGTERALALELLVLGEVAAVAYLP